MGIIVNGNEIVLTGTVGGYYWLEDGFSAGEVYMALMMIGDDQDVVVRVNSGGGAASEGSAIYSILAGHKARVDVVVEGWAASAASLLAMAGQTVTMMPGAVMMIHDPANITIGDAADHERMIKQLNAIGDASAEIYAKKTGKTPADMRALMKVETWMTGPQAVEAGFADEIGAMDDNPEPTAYAIQSYGRVPEHIVAIATARGWKPREGAPAASAAQPNKPKEISVTDKERADQLAAELAALQTKSKADGDALAALLAEKDDRVRQDAIMSLSEAVGREGTAKALAVTPGMTPDAAKAVLSASPKGEGQVVLDDAAELEKRRLNGTGLNGKPPSQASATSTRANMQKLLDKGVA